jgi:RNA polymerase sigma-32 factor
MIMASGSNVPATIPALGGEASLNRYLAEIKKFPILSPEQEFMLAKRFQEHGDTDAAAQLVTSHLRLVAKIAMGYRGYGLPVSELISEGNIGLMQGVKKFEPDRGFRLATYAMWWIRASIQEFILRSWSLVKMGTTAAQKKLFFNLRRMKAKLDAFEDGDLSPEHVAKIATDLGVTEEEVTSMNRRMAMGGDTSLNVPMREDGEGQWQDWLADEDQLQDERVAEAQEATVRHEMLVSAMEDLNERERHILTERRLTDDPKTLEELSQVYDVSRERVRQIEVRAFEKLQKAMMRIAGAFRFCVPSARLDSARDDGAAARTRDRTDAGSQAARRGTRSLRIADRSASAAFAQADGTRGQTAQAVAAPDPVLDPEGRPRLPGRLDRHGGDLQVRAAADHLDADRRHHRRPWRHQALDVAGPDRSEHAPRRDRRRGCALLHA